jgi:type IV pilus biogenesis protein CpaD/CtpE
MIVLGFLALLAATAMTGLTGCSSSADRLRNTFAASPAALRPPQPVSRAEVYCAAAGRAC